MLVRKSRRAHHLLQQIQHLTRFYVMNAPHFFRGSNLHVANIPYHLTHIAGLTWLQSLITEADSCALSV